MSDLPGYVEIRDDTIHPIQHVGNIPFENGSKQTYINNVLHVPTITKNLVSVGEMACKYDSNAKGALLKKMVD